MTHGGPRCRDNYTHALIPTTQVGLTDASNPILFFHVDRRSSQQKTSRTIALQLELFPIAQETATSPSARIDESPLYASTILVPVSVLPGIVGFRLPKVVSLQLKTGQFYRWLLQISCHQENSTPFSDIYDIDDISGILHPVELDDERATELAQAPPLEQVALYAKYGIWHESLSLLAQLRQAEPENATLIVEWKTLLESAGFGTRYRLSPQQLADSPLWF